MVIVGSKRMVQYDDTAADESACVRPGMDFKEPENFGEHQLSYRTGDIVVLCGLTPPSRSVSSCRTPLARSAPEDCPARMRSSG